MYENASSAFYEELKADSRLEHIRGKIGEVDFTDDNIISFNYNNRASDTKDVSFGLAYVGQIQVSFVDVEIPRGSWRNLKISLEYGLTIGQSIEWVPVGTFFVTEALWTDRAINITANDAMTKFDRAFTITQTTGTVFDFLSFACGQCGVELGMTAIECAALPNGTEILGLYPTNDIKTFRDFLGWVAQTVGGFATIDRSGKLVVRSWSNSQVVDELTDDDRMEGSSFSDFENQYSGISIVNADDKTTSYYGSGEGITINLGLNPLLQFGTDEIKNRQRNALASVAQSIDWTPFNAAIISNPIYDLGDLIEMTGGVAGSGTLTCCLMAIDWTFKDLTSFQGYGADPALSSGKSATDKAISGLISKTAENEIITHVFQNAEILELPEDEETEVIRIRFATVSPKVIKALHEICMEVEASGNDPVEAEVHYYLNNELIDSYKPIETWDEDGSHILSLMRALNSLEGNTRYEWAVKIMMKNGTATIARGYANAILEGQGLVAVNSWTGLIEVSDNIGLKLHRNIKALFTDDVIVSNGEVLSIEASDNLSLYLRGKINIQLYDEANIFTRQNIYRRITEDGKTRITEDNDTRITEGGNS